MCEPCVRKIVYIRKDGDGNLSLKKIQKEETI
jgi:hypothetical protein